MQKEFRQNTRYGSSSKHDDEEDFSLDAKVNKGKGNRFHPKYDASEDGKEHNMSKVKFFHCHEYGHISTNSWQKKKKNMEVGAGASEALALQFEFDLSLITCMVSIALG